MIRDMIDADLPIVSEILRLQLGNDCVFDEVKQLEEFKTWVFEDDGRVVGICTVEIVRKHERGFPLTDLPFGFIENIAVAPESCGKGIATKFIKESLEWLRGKVTHVMASAWVSKKGVNIKLPMERNGFVSVGNLPSFFDHCKDCPDCNPNACTCSAVLYRFDY